MDRPVPPGAPFGVGHTPLGGDSTRALVPPPIAGDSTTRGDTSIYRSAAVVTAPTRSYEEDDYHRALHSPLVVDAETVDRGVVQEQPGNSAGEALPVSIASSPHTEVSEASDNPRAPRRGAASLRDQPVPVIAVTAHRARNGFLLVAGSVVSAVLLTALNSDLPGDVGAQVTRDVYDSPTQSVVLIPRGAKLVGRLASGVVHGQRRVALEWVRINLPDGDVINLPGQPATDERGAAGMAADVDNHLFRTFSAAGIAAAIGAGVELSQPQNGVSVLTTPTVGQVLAGSLGQELGTVGLEVVRRELDVPPTLSLLPGALFNLLLTADLSFRQPYGATTP